MKDLLDALDANVCEISEDLCRRGKEEGTLKYWEGSVESVGAVVIMEGAVVNYQHPQ